MGTIATGARWMNHSNFTDGPWKLHVIFSIWRYVAWTPSLSTLHRKQRKTKVNKGHRTSRNHYCLLKNLSLPAGIFLRWGYVWSRAAICRQRLGALGEFRELLLISICGILWYWLLVVAYMAVWKWMILSTYNIESLLFLNHVLIEYACGVSPSDRYDFGIFRLRKGNLSQSPTRSSAPSVGVFCIFPTYSGYEQVLFGLFFLTSKFYYWYAWFQSNSLFNSSSFCHKELPNKKNKCPKTLLKRKVFPKKKLIW